MTIFDKLIDSNQLTADNKSVSLPSPLSGSIVPLDQFPCPAHKLKMFGEGIAVSPSGFQILSPFNAVVEEFPSTCERIRLRTKSGIRMQIQFGLAAERLMGEGLKAKVKAKHPVKKGQVLMEFDLPKLKLKLTSVLCPITILNSEKIKGIIPHYRQVIALEDDMMTLVV